MGNCGSIQHAIGVYEDGRGQLLVVLTCRTFGLGTKQENLAALRTRLARKQSRCLRRVVTSRISKFRTLT